MSVTNPYTGRKIQRGGKIHRQLQKGGVLTEEERAFIANNNKKAQFKRAIDELPYRDQAGYIQHLEDPNFARHLRDALSDIEIYRKRQNGGGLFGKKDRYIISDNTAQRILEYLDRVDISNEFLGLAKELPTGSKMLKEGVKSANNYTEFLNKLRSSVTTKKDGQYVLE